MSTVIKHTNDSGNYITDQQVSFLQFYNKEFFINGNELKLIEKYGPQGRSNKSVVLKGGEYYLSPDEDLQLIINQHSTTAPYWTFCYNKQTNNYGDVYWEYLFYKNGELDVKGRQVFNNEKLLIASCTIDLETNQLKNRRKFFYGDLNFYKRNEYESHFLSVSYNENNDVSDIYIYDDDYQSVNEFLSSTNSIHFDWLGNTYFHSFEPILPTTIIA
ncbi:hypothetical protein NU08_4306 [Flavobacterium anhuiense]|uniref:Uncharacterized protein n=1 Tax=Flavobacterium anhuiense TaxID=459526 RepID=A0A444VST1_9FLAO|nr:hypothetical protein [Flavobacterium anhuiense]RYJ36698.1 hypothetical protein NU08_4306 [Flavobacterium anhuiense]